MVKQTLLYRLLVLVLCICGMAHAAIAQQNQENQGTPFGYFGLEFGPAQLYSMPRYSPALPELFANGREMRTLHYHQRLFVGYAWANKHRLELSAQNLNFRSVYGIDLGDGSVKMGSLTKGALYLSLGYLYRVVDYKRLRFTLGPHIGWAIAGKSDFGSNVSYVSVATDAEGHPLATLSYQHEELRLKEQFLNLGLRSNLALALGPEKRFEFFLHGSFLYTPYEIRGLNLSYRIDNGPQRRATTTTNIVNWTFGLGFRQCFAL